MKQINLSLVVNTFTAVIRKNMTFVDGTREAVHCAGEFCLQIWSAARRFTWEEYRVQQTFVSLCSAKYSRRVYLKHLLPRKAKPAAVP